MLTTLQKVKDMLGITSTTFDTQLNALLFAADAAIKTELDREIERTTRTEFYSGNGLRTICLRETPVISITSVHQNFSGYYGQNVDSLFSSETLLTAGSHYVLQIDKNGISYTGILERIGTVWAELSRSYTQAKVTQEATPAQGNIKVVYEAGYSNVPEDLQYCVVLTIQRMRQLLPYGYLMDSEKLGDYSYSLGLTFRKIMLEVGQVERILRKYRKTPW